MNIRSILGITDAGRFYKLLKADFIAFLFPDGLPGQGGAVGPSTAVQINSNGNFSGNENFTADSFGNVQMFSFTGVWKASTSPKLFWAGPVAGDVGEAGFRTIRLSDLPAGVGASASYLTNVTGDGTTAVYNVDHNLNNLDPVVSVRDSAGNQVGVDNQCSTPNRVVLTFGPAPENGAVYRVKVSL